MLAGCSPALRYCLPARLDVCQHAMPDVFQDVVSGGIVPLNIGRVEVQGNRSPIDIALLATNPWEEVDANRHGPDRHEDATVD